MESTSVTILARRMAVALQHYSTSEQAIQSGRLFYEDLERWCTLPLEGGSSTPMDATLVRLLQRNIQFAQLSLPTDKDEQQSCSFENLQGLWKSRGTLKRTLESATNRTEKKDAPSPEKSVHDKPPDRKRIRHGVAQVRTSRNKTSKPKFRGQK